MSCFDNEDAVLLFRGGREGFETVGDNVCDGTSYHVAVAEVPATALFVEQQGLLLEVLL